MPERPSKLDRLLRRPSPGNGDFGSMGPYEAGNKLTLYTRGGETFQAMWKAIENAKDTIHLETYILTGDRTGEEFSWRLCEKARAGVRVRMIIDSLGCLELDLAYIMKLRNSGVQVLEYHPVAPWRARWDLQKRDHRKILVVDGQIAFTGGMNISNQNAPTEMGGLNWRDTHVKVEGPAAYALDRLFRAVWFRETGRWFNSEGKVDYSPGPAKAWVAHNQEFLQRYTIRSTYLRVLRAARREVLITNAYFVPDRGIRRALIAAAKRGVSVKVLVPGRSDIKSVWYAGRANYGVLLENGVRLFEWTGPGVLHAKTAAVDRTWCAVGSYNLDHRSLLHNLECNLHVLDPEFGAKLADRFEEDLAQAREITLERWEKRPGLDRVIERFFYLFRYFF
jgi:cardiolipin synthase A/B